MRIVGNNAAFVAIILSLKLQESIRQTDEQRRLETSNLPTTSAKKRKCNRRQSWFCFQSQLSDQQFCCYFRMTRGVLPNYVNKLKLISDVKITRVNNT